MKKIASKKPQTPNKGASLVKKSPVQKSIVKKKPAQNKQKKSKDVEANLSIKEKLSGKIFSPTVEKSKNIQQKKVANKSPTGKAKPSAGKPKILPAQAKKKTNEKKLEVKEEKPVLPVKKNNKNVKQNIKNEEKVIPEIKKQTKVIVPKVDKTVDANKAKVEVKATTATKRKLKSDQPKVQIKKTKSKEEVKVESVTSPVSLDVKTEDQNTVSKPKQSKAKRKSSVTSIKDLKPISNIKTLVKRPVKKISKAQIKKKLEKFPERGVCYFSHIPHGFYEKELKKYCSQFGEVTGVYHPVSKSGNSRGYAFVEFKHKEVAEVVADAMNNYLMFNRLLKCQYIPPEAQRPWVFKNERNNMKEAALRRRENLQMQMRSLSKDEVKKWKKRRQMKVKSLHKKLSKLGVDYEFQVNDPNENVAQEETKEESAK